MKHNQYDIPAPLILKLATLLALTIAFLASGCETSKSFQSTKNDTTSVKKSVEALDIINQGAALRTEDNRSHEENEWSRLTLKWLAEKNDGDTTINNLITQPATVIFETGRSNRDEATKIVDSSWHQSLVKMIAASSDSMSRKIDNYEKTKHSETKGIGWITISLLGIGLIALNKLIDFKPIRRP